MSLSTIRFVILALFAFFAGGSYWGWGTEWLAGLFGLGYFVFWIVEIITNRITLDDRPGRRF